MKVIILFLFLLVLRVNAYYEVPLSGGVMQA